MRGTVNRKKARNHRDNRYRHDCQTAAKAAVLVVGFSPMAHINGVFLNCAKKVIAMLATSASSASEGTAKWVASRVR